MRATAWMLLLAVLMQTPAYADRKSDKVACEKVKEQIRVIESRMRDGYSAAQGIRFDAKLRKLKDRRYKICR